MKQPVLLIFYKCFFILFSLIFVCKTQAQSKDENTQIEVQDDKIQSVSDILKEGEKLNLRIIKLNKTLKPSDVIIRLDSVLNIDTAKIFQKRDSLLPELNNIATRALKAHKVEWINTLTYLKEYQNIVNERREEISEIKNELSSELTKWKLIREKLNNDYESNNSNKEFDGFINSLEGITEKTQIRLDSIFLIQKKLIELILTVDETIYSINQVELQIKKKYFVFDSNPIWKPLSVDSKDREIDSISTGKSILLKFKQNKTQLKEFLSSNAKILIAQLLFILLLLLLIIRAKNKWKNDLGDLNNPIVLQAKIILSRPFFTTIVIALPITYFFYEAVIPSFVELFILFTLIGTIVLLPQITIKKLRATLLLIFAVYLLYILESYLNPQSYISRFFAIIEAVILIIALITGRKIMNNFHKHFKTVYKLFNVLSPLYVFVLSIAILTNFIGMMNLSRFLIKGILASTIFGMVVLLSVKAIVSIAIMFLKLKKTYSIKTLSTIFSVTHRRILPVLNFIGLILWLVFTLKGFDVFDLLISWINDLMQLQWKIGELVISLGGILSFLVIFIVTIILSKLTTTLFKDEWMINIFPRGVASAISLMLKILLISIGFYIALTAAGVDISKLGFIIGALGVGIGFGLQNVVLNFIAGLILAFERPINIGDTIEVDQEMGVVTDIGVRASSIKSYSGYEVIVPNGDLISKKVINYTLNNRDRRSKILMKTSPNPDPEKTIALFNKIASEHPNTYSNPEPETLFYGFCKDGNLSFALFYWSTFSDTLKVDHDIALKIFKVLKKEGIQAPTPTLKIIKED
jgi:small-conductance mechanosensitive channel